MGAILVTGCAGFIGFHLTRRLLEQGSAVVGVDNLNAYYDVTLKQARLAILHTYPAFRLFEADLSDTSALTAAFDAAQPHVVFNLAAQAGVRYSVQNPAVYIQSNVVGFGNILEDCRRMHVEHLIFASSSSVYGANTEMPFSIHHNVDHPLSLYAASKKANELMAHSYAHLFELPVTGLRLFTVYGPWGRPDMALFSFTRAILEGKRIDVYGDGLLRRDFTYIDDIVDGFLKVMERPATANPAWDGHRPDPGTSLAPYRIYNIGSHRPIQLSYFIDLIEQNLGLPAKRNMLPSQPGDLPDTYADIEDLIADTGFTPQITVEEGVARFVEWYRSYYKV